MILPFLSFPVFLPHVLKQGRKLLSRITSALHILHVLFVIKEFLETLVKIPWILLTPCLSLHGQIEERLFMYPVFLVNMPELVSLSQDLILPESNPVDFIEGREAKITEAVNRHTFIEFVGVERLILYLFFCSSSAFRNGVITFLQALLPPKKPITVSIRPSTSVSGASM